MDKYVYVVFSGLNYEGGRIDKIFTNLEFAKKYVLVNVINYNLKELLYSLNLFNSYCDIEINTKYYIFEQDSKNKDCYTYSNDYKYIMIKKIEIHE